MNKDFYILYGFDQPPVSDQISRYIANFGYKVTSNIRLSKQDIKNFLEEHEEYNTVIISENVSSVNPYEASELAELTESRDINVVVVLSEIHKGTKYMHTLINAGITSAIFETNNVFKKKIAKSDELALLAVKKRSRKEARHYYGIEDDKLDLDVLQGLDYEYYLGKLGDSEYGERLINRFVYICTKKLSSKHTYDFILKLPEEYISRLIEEDEFYDVIDALKKEGYKTPYKRPKTSKKMLSEKKSIEEDPFIETRNDSIEETLEDKNVSEFNFGNYNHKDEKVLKDKKANASFNLPKEKPKMQKGYKEEKAADNKKYIIGICIFGCVLLLSLAACGTIEKDKNDKALTEIEESKEASAIELSISEEKMVESVSEDSVIEGSTDKEEEIDENETSESEAENVDESVGADTKSVSGSYVSDTGLVVSNKGNTDDYTYYAREKSSAWKLENLSDGMMVNGLDVVNIINGNSNVRFKVTNPYTGEVCTYENGGASAADIPVDQPYKLTAASGTYIFSIAK